jgi:hypothetical protein
MKSSRTMLLLSLSGAALGLCISLVYVLARGSSSGITPGDRAFLGPFADIFHSLFTGAAAFVGAVTAVLATLLGAIIGSGIGLFLTRPRARLPLLIGTLILSAFVVWKILARQATDPGTPF